MIWREGLAVSAAIALLLGVSPAAAQTAKGGSEGVATAIGGGGGLVVGGINVDVGGKSSADARISGWREAQREAWPKLWERMSGQPAGSAPKLADGSLDSIVSAIEIEREQIGPNRYVARLAVVFDRVRVSSYLGRYANLASSPPFLVLPVLQDAATRMAHEQSSPWLAAWARLRAGETPIDYVRIKPTPGDTILLNSWQAGRRHIFLWRVLIDRYQVADVVIPELILDRQYPGGPATGLLIVRFGPSGREVGRTRLRHPAGDVNALMDLAVREADRMYVSALRGGLMVPDPDLIEPDAEPENLASTEQFAEEAAGFRLLARTATPDDASLQSVQRIVAGTPGVTGVRLQSLVLGGESVIEITSGVSQAALIYALDQRGLRLEGDLLRRRAPTDTPIAAPAPIGEVPIEESVPGEGQ